MMDQVKPLVVPALLREVQDNRDIIVALLPLYGSDSPSLLNTGQTDLAISNFVSDANDYFCDPFGPSVLVLVALHGHPGLANGATLEAFKKNGHAGLIPGLRECGKF